MMKVMHDTNPLPSSSFPISWNRAHKQHVVGTSHGINKTKLQTEAQNQQQFMQAKKFSQTSFISPESRGRNNVSSKLN